MPESIEHLWWCHIGKRVVFTYHHGETAEGVITGVNERYVFVRFGTKANSEACDPERLSVRRY